MNHTLSQAHVADPDFVRYLGWQLEHELRRRARFAPPPRRPARLLAVAALVLAGATLGAGGMAAAAAVQDAPHKAVRIERARVAAAAAVERQRFFEAAWQETMRLRADAMTSDSEVHAVEAALGAATTEARLRILDLEEVEAGGQEPSDALSAPRVGGRDFVGERLAVRLADLAGANTLLDARMQRARELHEAGFASAAEVQALEQERSTLAGSFHALEASAGIRGQFLAGALSPQQAEREGALARSLAHLEAAAAAETGARAALQAAQALYAAGALGAAELRASERTAREAEAARRLSELDLRLLESLPPR
ncbi:MAG: hypothetical protein EYC70_15065 [Planctomycetota bacterium]|nr:MAG: hypothetical protein EYC70_15065 [Planctomycetota bacterium]